jgi:hypothetical protein
VCACHVFSPLTNIICPHSCRSTDSYKFKMLSVGSMKLTVEFRMTVCGKRNDFWIEMIHQCAVIDFSALFAPELSGGFCMALFGSQEVIPKLVTRHPTFSRPLEKIHFINLRVTDGRVGKKPAQRKRMTKCPLLGAEQTSQIGSACPLMTQSGIRVLDRRNLCRPSAMPSASSFAPNRDGIASLQAVPDRDSVAGTLGGGQCHTV